MIFEEEADKNILHLTKYLCEKFLHRYKLTCCATCIIQVA